MQADSRSITSSLASASVQKAITILGSGLLAHPLNTTLREHLRSGALSVQDYYSQVLRFVYRLIVLFIAEDRGILFHPGIDQTARNRFTARYSTALLRRLATRHGRTNRSNLYRDLWFVLEKLAGKTEGVEPGFCSPRGLCFSGAAMPDLAGCELANRDLLKAVRTLAFTAENAIDCAVDYKNLGAVELGGIYESLLEMRPRINLDAAAFELTFASGNPRKTSGSYYTPGSLIGCLLDAVLEPALAEACATSNPQQALLDLKVCDPACGSGLFLIAAAYRMAQCLTALRSGGEAPGQETLRAALRDVVSRCIYGVDLNPMAVELCRVSLWLETAGPGESLSAGDLHIRCGNSLLGATPALLARGIPGSAWQDQFFHWHEAFPTVFSLPVGGERPDNEQTGWNGGFDVVLGNPPYIFGENLPQEVKQVFPSIFALARGQYDTYWLFIEQSLKLINARGRCALVVPDTLLARDETRSVRELLLQEGLERLYYCGTAFKAHVSTIIFAVTKGSAAREVLYEEIDEAEGDVRVRSMCSKARFRADPKRRFLTRLSDEEALMLARVEDACESLRDLVKISRGEELGKKDVLPQGPVPIVVGEDIARYIVKPPTRFLETIKKDTWRYAAPRILMLKTGYRCVAALDTVGYVTMQSVYTLHITRSEVAYETLLALLNSRFACWFVYKVFTSYKGLFPQLNQSTIQAIPVPLNIGSKQDELMQLVQQMMALKKATADENVHCAQIEQVDREIDRMIYALYGLNEAEVALVDRKNYHVRNT
jgi:methylase of polypeptide subunit release factors